MLFLRRILRTKLDIYLLIKYLIKYARRSRHQLSFLLHQMCVLQIEKILWLMHAN